MQINTPTLIIEIKNSEYIFVVGENNEDNNFKLLYKNIIQTSLTNDNKIFDYESINKVLKKNIYLIEQKFNFTFKETILILSNFECSFLNFTGFKKLNGSQLTKENVSYILNSLKSKINELEKNKTILHIFSSKYNLDQKSVENLPIGLFGDFYSQELTFFLINSNDLKNFNNIFNRCNLRIKKILLKSFVEGVNLINKNSLETFFKIVIKKNCSELIFFENSALKFTQYFNFGSDIIIKDISKITSLKTEVVKKLISNSTFRSESFEQNINEKYFENGNFRKIKKKLIYDIARARIQEMANLILLNNINLTGFFKKMRSVYLKIDDQMNLSCFDDSFEKSFSKKSLYKIKLIQENLSAKDSIYHDASKIAHFGWKKEAIPVTQNKHSFISGIFRSFFE